MFIAKRSKITFMSLGILFMFLSMVMFLSSGYADTIPPDSHRVTKVVKIDNVNQFRTQGYYLVAKVISVNGTVAKTYIIDQDEALTMGYKFNTLTIYAVKESHIKYINNEDFETDSNAIPANTNDDKYDDDNNNDYIKPVDYWVSNSNPLVGEETTYSIAGITEDYLFLYKKKSVLRYNDGTPVKTETFDEPVLSDLILGVSPSSRSSCFIDTLIKEGKITPAVALTVFRCYLGLNECPDGADVNKDGSVTPSDALCLFKYYLKLPSCLDRLSLLDQEWTLQSLGIIGEETSLIPGTKITIQFTEDNKIQGTSGCNMYFGTYKAPEGDVLSTSNIGCTKMACWSPQGVMEQEMRYLEALGNVCSFEVDQNNLKLFYDAKQKVCNFTINQTPEIDLDQYKELASNAPCADLKNRLFLIDGCTVLWDRGGNCPDNAYSVTLFGSSVDNILCSLSDSIAGPRKFCNDQNYEDMFETIINNLDDPDLGLEGHTVESIPFDREIYRNPSGNLPNDYVSGDVLVGFFDEVTEEEVDNLIKSYNLSWESHFPTMFAYWVKVLSGAPADHIAKLESSDIVYWAESRGYSDGEAGCRYILVQFNSTATVATASQLIDSFENLEITSLNVAPKWGVVAVPAGAEQQWIDTFETNAIVKHAELNIIRHPNRH
ncbi:MAG: hypothetical protein QG646_3280 [Euryarchaeota archaeon]|nr:hypothetical protein [Euryarchaeota archaeon]